MPDSEEMLGDELSFDLLNSGGIGPKKGKGRPHQISDDDLKNRRGALLFVLEQYWPFVGWELQQAKTMPELRLALRVITGINCHELEPFVTSPTKLTTHKELQEQRALISDIAGTLRSLYAEQNALQEERDRTQAALCQCKKPKDRKWLADKLARQNSAFEEIVAQIADARRRYERSAEELAEREAFFVQSELLEFVREQRYSHDPLGFANAMAGLPFVGWRQSSTRCARFAKPISGLVYQKFLIVAKALRNCPRSRKDILRNIKAEARKSPKQSAVAHAELRREWLYMLRSVEQTNPSKEVGAAIPYRICARFEQNRQHRNAFDIAVESEHAL